MAHIQLLLAGPSQVENAADCDMQTADIADVDNAQKDCGKAQVAILMLLDAGVATNMCTTKGLSVLLSRCTHECPIAK